MAPSRRDDDDTRAATDLLAGDGEREREREGAGEGAGEGVGVDECAGDGERGGKSEREGAGEGVGECVGVGEGECEGAGEGVGECVGVGVMITYQIHDWNQHGEEIAFDVEAKAHGEAIRATITLAIADDRLVPTFPDVERWVPAPMLAFFTSYSEDPSSEVEDGLLDELYSAVDVDKLDFESSCGHCAGSGEGMYDGSRCWSCRGSGTERRVRDDDE